MAGSRILVVEDDRPIAAMLDRVLGTEGYDVDVANDGGEALRRARERPFDLVVLDLMLPGLDGIAVCRRLRAASSIPILVLTARGRTEDRVLGLDSGADDYMAKPFHNGALLARVRAPSLRRAAPRTGHPPGLEGRPHARPHIDRVRPSRAPDAPPAAGAVARAAARRRLEGRCGDGQRGRRLRRVPPSEAR